MGCGEPRVHHGIASELRSIFKAFGREIKETLRHCAKVYSIGHSLGGGLAEMFAFCANRHDPHNADYRLIGFDKDEKPTKLEEIDLTTCRGGRVVSKRTSFHSVGPRTTLRCAFLPWTIQFHTM